MIFLHRDWAPCIIVPVPDVPVLDAPLQHPVQPLQRVAAVRRQQGISRRTLARRMNVDLSAIREQESETYDLTLSQLYAVAKAPRSSRERIVGRGRRQPRSPRHAARPTVRLMKSALAIKENAKQESIRRMVETLIEQLLEIMPELAGVGPWHAVGKRRRLDELGVAADR